MENISLILYTKGFFGSVLKSPTQMGSLSINNSVTNISRLGTFKHLFKLHSNAQGFAAGAPNADTTDHATRGLHGVP
jgi:hypothetical protein